MQTNFLAQLFRTDLSLQQNPDGSAIRDSELISETFEYAFNRRLMIGLIGNYRWIDSRVGEDEDGGAVAGFLRLQLVNTNSSSVASTFRVGEPNRDCGERMTTLSLSLAGWHDLAPLGLKRMGLYWHVQEETLAGPHDRGERRNSLTYDLSLAKTWTRPDAFFGNTTTFIEGYGRTDLDGKMYGSTLVTLTPGVRATFAHRHIIMVGVDFPVSESRPFDRIFRLTYIVSF